MLYVHGAAQAHHVVGAVAAGDAVPARVVAPVEIELFGGLQGGLHRDVLCFGPPLEGEGESHGNRSYAGNVRNSCSSSACVSRSSTPIDRKSTRLNSSH